MAEQKIITISDIQTYFDVPSTVDTNKINIAIWNAQQIDLKRALGEALYYDFIEDFNGTNFDTPKYQTLFDGDSFTYQNNIVYFTGIVQLLSSYAFIHIVKNNKIHVVRSGVVVKVVEQSETAEDFQLRNIVRGVYDRISQYEAELFRYLYENRATHPLYLKKTESTQKKTGFNFYRV